MPLGLTDQTSDLVSLLYGACAVVTIVVLVRRGRQYWRGNLGPADTNLAWAAGFFLCIPIGVFLHELGHAVATWSVGGEVAQLSWRVYWGFVVPVGAFTALEAWWISLSGNLVSVLVGVVLLWIAARDWHLRPAVGYLLFAAGELQVIWALIGYPLLTAGGYGVYGSSDWRTIYDFSATPVASGATLLVHIGLVAGLILGRHWLAWTAWQIAHGNLAQVSRLRTAIVEDPTDIAARRRLTELLLEAHQHRKAAEVAAAGLQACGEDPYLYAALAVALIRQERFHEALGPLRRADEIFHKSREVRQWVRSSLGIALTATGHTAEALDVFASLDEAAAADPAVRVWRERAMSAAAQAGS